MLSAVILTFSKAIGTFGVINYLGSKVNFVTLSSQLYMNSKSQNTQTAFAMALIMICIASISVFVNQKLIGSRKSYATIGGKGGRSTPIRLGKHKPLITAVLFLFFVFGIIMPIALLILESFMLRQGDYSLSNLTLHYWIGDPIATVMEGQPGIFKNANFINSLINSLKLTFVNGVFGTIFGQIIGYICAKGRGKLHGKVVEQLVFIPYLIPSIAFGGIFLSMFSAPQQLFGVTLVPSLYGTVRPADHYLGRQASAVRFPRRHLQYAADRRRAGGSSRALQGAGFFKRFIQHCIPAFQGRLHFGLHADLRFHYEGTRSDHPADDARKPPRCRIWHSSIRTVTLRRLLTAWQSSCSPSYSWYTHWRISLATQIWRRAWAVDPHGITGKKEFGK